MKIIFYALRHIDTKKIMSFDYNSNGEDSCNPTSVELEMPWGSDLIEHKVWLASSREAAERVAKKSTPWYSADQEKPEYNDRFKDKLEVVEIELEVKG